MKDTQWNGESDAEHDNFDSPIDQSTSYYNPTSSGKTNFSPPG